MNIDLSKLPPAPWRVVKDHETGWPYIPHPSGFPMLLPERDDHELDLAALAFAALARNAFDVMMRRGWTAVGAGDGRWFASDDCSGEPDSLGQLALRGYGTPPYAADPFTALVEADHWYKENVENTGQK